MKDSFTNTILFPPFSTPHRVGLEISVSPDGYSLNFIYLLSDKFRYDISESDYYLLHDLFKSIYLEN